MNENLGRKQGRRKGRGRLRQGGSKRERKGVMKEEHWIKERDERTDKVKEKEGEGKGRSIKEEMDGRK